MKTKPENTAPKAENDFITETSIKVGKALARTTVKAESSTKKVKKMAEDLIDAVSAKAAGVKKSAAAPRKAPQSRLPLAPASGLSVEGHLGFLAGDIYRHLEAEGQTEVNTLLQVLKTRQHSEAMIYAAMGWLAREGRVTFTPDGSSLTIR